MSNSYCNIMIGLPKSWRTDSKWYRQSSRPSLHVFILQELNTAEGASGDVIERGLRRACVSPSTRPCSWSHGEPMTLLIAWASGQRYATAPQTASNYITRSTRPSRFFSRTLREGLDTRLCAGPRGDASFNRDSVAWDIHIPYILHVSSSSCRFYT